MTIISLISQSLRQSQKLHDFARFRISARHEWKDSSAPCNIPLIRFICLALYSSIYLFDDEFNVFLVGECQIILYHLTPVGSITLSSTANWYSFYCRLSLVITAYLLNKRLNIVHSSFGLFFAVTHSCGGGLILAYGAAATSSATAILTIISHQTSGGKTSRVSLPSALNARSQAERSDISVFISLRRNNFVFCSHLCDPGA